jgi:hypothetical protein
MPEAVLKFPSRKIVFEKRSEPIVLRPELKQAVREHAELSVERAFAVGMQDDRALSRREQQMRIPKNFFRHINPETLEVRRNSRFYSRLAGAKGSPEIMDKLYASIHGAMAREYPEFLKYNRLHDTPQSFSLFYWGVLREYAGGIKREIARRSIFGRFGSKNAGPYTEHRINTAIYALAPFPQAYAINISKHFDGVKATMLSPFREALAEPEPLLAVFSNSRSQLAEKLITGAPLKERPPEQDVALGRIVSLFNKNFKYRTQTPVERSLSLIGARFRQRFRR